jgi:hypothetical protein
LYREDNIIIKKERKKETFHGKDTHTSYGKLYKSFFEVATTNGFSFHLPHFLLAIGTHGLFSRPSNIQDESIELAL